MNAVEAAALLVTCAAYDNRKASDEANDAWATALYDITLEDGVKAVHVHYRESTDRIMPAHVRRIVSRVKAVRWKTHGPLDSAAAPPPQLDDRPADAIRWQRAYRRAIGEGATREQADAHACDTLGIVRPREVGPARRGDVRRLIESAPARQPERVS